MFTLLAALEKIIAPLAYPTQDRDDRYLSEATDIYDLERRMREVDTGRDAQYAVGSYGIFAR